MTNPFAFREPFVPEDEDSYKRVIDYAPVANALGTATADRVHNLILNPDWPENGPMLLDRPDSDPSNPSALPASPRDPIPNRQSPIPNPQSPIPNRKSPIP